MPTPSTIYLGNWITHPYPPYKDGRYAKTTRPALPFLQSNCSEFTVGAISGSNKGPFDSVDILSASPHPLPVVENQSSIFNTGTSAIRIAYANDEDEGIFKLAFPKTRCLFVRKYERFGSGWTGQWPAGGIKTGRYFSTSDYNSGGTSPDRPAYMSEKAVYMRAQSNPSPPPNAYCTLTYGQALNHAIIGTDFNANYPVDVLFGNGLPYIRPDHWYKMETWMIFNSAPDVADGVMQFWVDDQLVLDLPNVAYTTSLYANQGTHFQSMWFGGNLSRATGTYADADGLAVGVSSASSPITLNGALISGGTFTAPDAREYGVVITDLGGHDQTTATYTITGTDELDNPVVANIAGPSPNSSVYTSFSDWCKTITSITITNPVAGSTVDIGTLRECGEQVGTLDRYIDNFYLSTTLDR